MWRTLCLALKLLASAEGLNELGSVLSLEHSHSLPTEAPSATLNNKPGLLVTNNSTDFSGHLLGAFVETLHCGVLCCQCCVFGTEICYLTVF